MGRRGGRVRAATRWAAVVGVAFVALAGWPSASEVGASTPASAARSRPRSLRGPRKPPPPTASTSTSTSTTTTTAPAPVVNPTLAAQAQADECFAGIGTPYPSLADCASAQFTYNSTLYSGQPKASQSYPWSMAKVDGRLWLGTVANVLCQGLALDIGGGASTPFFMSKRLVCEFGSSAYGIANSLPAASGDFRPPQVLTYDLSTNLATADPATTVVDRSPVDDPLFDHTGGLRFASSTADLVLFGGPDIVTQQVNFFAYRRSDLSYLGSFTDATYTDVRRGVNAGGALYVAVGNQGGGGSVLRWTGTLANPFSYTVVGTMDNEAAEITLAGDRLAVGTWPNQLGNALTIPPPAGVYVSPALGGGGLNAASADKWRKIWSVSNYEIDTITAATYGIGAMAWYNNALYFGTVHWVNGALLAHNAVYGSLTSADGTPYYERLRGTLRATILVRASGLGARTPTLTLLYGDQQLWRYSAFFGWALLPSGMGGGILGPSGLGNPYNLYTWSMAPFRDRLFIGTLDSRILVSSSSWTTAINGGWVPAFTSPLGADLYSLGPTGGAVVENDNGFNNAYSYGIRNLVADGTGLWAGVANPFNLAYPSNTGQYGGWKLFRVSQ